MHPFWTLTAGLAAISGGQALAAPALAPFVVKGATSVSVTAVNDYGDVAGNFVKRGQASGFVSRGGVLHVLPPILINGARATPFPAAMGPEHGVAGYAAVTTKGAQESYVFLYAGGTYSFTSSIGTCGAPDQGGIFLTTKDLAFNNCNDQTIFVRQGNAAPTAIEDGGFFNFLAGASDTGLFVWTLAGGTAMQPVIYAMIGNTSGYSELGPNGNSEGCAADGMNATGQAVGLCQDGTAFAYSNGAFTSFVGPGGAAISTVQGIDNRARIVGTYADSAGQHCYVYLNGVSRALGAFPADDLVTISISRKGGHIAVQDYSTVSKTAKSYLAQE